MSQHVNCGPGSGMTGEICSVPPRGQCEGTSEGEHKVTQDHHHHVILQDSRNYV